MVPTLLNGSTPLLPTGNLFFLEGKGSASTSTEQDIYGNQVVVSREIKTANQLWSLGAAYVDLTTTQAVIAAYEAHTTLTLTDEAGTSYTTIITEYPAIERHKMPDGSVTYTIKVTLGLAPTTWGIPVVSLTGPRQFNR
jgi:hypothetical protein